MSSWRECKLGDIAEVIGGGTPKTSIAEYWNGNIPWLTPRDLTGYTKVYISHGERLITNDGLKSSSAKIMPKGTVLLTSRAPIGYVAIAENEVCTNQGFKSLVPNIEFLNSEFLYYWLYIFRKSICNLFRKSTSDWYLTCDLVLINISPECLAFLYETEIFPWNKNIFPNTRVDE